MGLGFSTINNNMSNAISGKINVFNQIKEDKKSKINNNNASSIIVDKFIQSKYSEEDIEEKFSYEESYKKNTANNANSIDEDSNLYKRSDNVISQSAKEIKRENTDIKEEVLLYLLVVWIRNI